ncbi:MAG: sigma-54-dependent Fis family transcriptional regulator [Smithellaceae bacterium]|nr:sigma-54-dependent Fis family transcriptional regulator [Syntrophaceae bacterium]MDD4242196.1 sigma-54-dependent Fis family transcriptional regulator [Smithellaceae bacterium]NLX50533.1 sigma-54-dependent Fis family transcriptional regulator [Deltaproteobacteria bacterium]
MAEKQKSPKRQLLRDMNLMGAEYYERFYQQTFHEWRRFISGDPKVDPAIIPQEVLDSWWRCARLGVDPLSRPNNKVLVGEELEDLLERNREFIDVSRPFMTNLYRFLEGSGFMVSLLDRDVYVLEVLGDPEEDKLVRTAKGFVGACWHERYAGNQAGGTVAYYKKPLQVFGSQHYIRLYQGATGSGAPIFNPDGEFAGVIAIFGRYYRANPHTLGMAVAAAGAIENELRIRRALAESRVAASYQRTVISSIQEALIAVDSAGRVTLINDNARKKFGLAGIRVEGRPIRDLYSRDNAHFFTLIESGETTTDAEVRITSRNQAGDYTLTCNPILSADQQMIGKIILLNEIQRAKSMVTKMMGASANFRFDDIYGQNARFLMTVDQARMVSRSNSNVLLLGKSGTGKDIFAQAIHNESERRNGPYVAINCGAIPRDLIASELFGHEEGAFTGSRRGGNQGKFELADGGTLFLDEIAETPLELQTALLRVIEDKSVLRIGGTRVRPVDVRIIAATNKDLREEVRKGNFREDLYYRANVFAIEMVPLKERLDDIPLLADYFVKRYASTMKKRITQVDKRVIEAFMNYSWPGNVRELQNAIERMINFLKTPELTVDLVPDHIRRPTHVVEHREDAEAPQEAERMMILRMLGAKMRKNRIAEKMNISRATLYRKMKQYNLK